MLSHQQRVDRYLTQTGSTRLTPRQRRRVKRKLGHQSAAAALVRESRSAALKEMSAARKRRAALPA